MSITVLALSLPTPFYWRSWQASPCSFSLSSALDFHSSYFTSPGSTWEGPSSKLGEIPLFIFILGGEPANLRNCQAPSREKREVTATESYLRRWFALYNVVFVSSLFLHAVLLKTILCAKYEQVCQLYVDLWPCALHEVCGCHRDQYECHGSLGYDAVTFGRYVLMFRRNLLLFSSTEEVVLTENLVRSYQTTRCHCRILNMCTVYPFGFLYFSFMLLYLRAVMYILTAVCLP